MKRKKRPTRKEKQQKFKTVSNWLRGKAEFERKRKAVIMDREFKQNEKIPAEGNNAGGPNQGL